MHINIHFDTPSLFFYREKAGMRLLFRQPSHPTEIPVALSSKNHHHQKKNSSQSFLKIIRMKFSAPESQKVFYCDALR
jgi:hypothetical protein